MKVDLHDKVALVTGGAQGIGKAIVEVLAENGARVIVADVNEKVARETAAEFKGSVALKLDVSQESSVEEGLIFIAEQLGRVDILVNNAGVNTRHRVNIDQFSNDDWDRIMNVDLRGLFLVSRAVSKLMIAQNGGRIVNISSVMGVVPARLQCAFTAAKAGVNNLTRAMALELAPHNILVNCVAPGSTLTDGTKSLFYGGEMGVSDTTKRMLAHVPLNRPGTTAEIANAVLYFVAPESSYTTGQVLCVDGGWTAGGFFRDF